MNRKNIIFHIDVNSAFLSWTVLTHEGEPSFPQNLLSIPSAVGGDEEKRHGIILAKSGAAKRYGVRTGEAVMSARKKCPHLVLVPPDYSMYVKYSRQMMELLSEYTPDVYQYSIDEAFLDMTGMEKLFGEPIACAHTIAGRIRRELGFTVNVGISTNYLLAKMASDFEKPDKVHTLFPEEIEEKMWPLSVGELFSVGRSTVSKLEKLGIRTIGELAKQNREDIVRIFKSHGGTIWDYANGIESASMVSDRVENKGYGNSVTTSYDLKTPEEARQLLLSLCETVGARLRMDGMKGSVVTVQMVDQEFHRWSHQANVGRNTDSTNEIFQMAARLLAEAWTGRPIRLLGVSVSRATKEDYHQMSLFGEEESEKQQRLDRAIDAIRKRYGEDAVLRSSFLNSRVNPMTGGLGEEKRRQKRSDI